MKIWADENLRPTKIKGHLWNLFKREVINSLSTCVQKFTVLLWVKIEIGKKKQVFSLKEIFWKKYQRFNKDKKIFSKWFLNFFIDILNILHSVWYTCRIQPSDYDLFFLYHMISISHVWVSNPIIWMITSV